MSNKLLKPYTDIQRADFVCLHQGLNYYEDDNCIIMYSNSEKIENGESIDISQTIEYITLQLAKAKADKLAEIDLKAKDYEQNGTVEYKNCLFEMSDSNRKNLSDTQEALTLQGLTSTQWNSKDDTLVELTIEDIQNIRLNLK